VERHVDTVGFTHRIESPAELLDALRRGTVRAAALLEAQTPALRAQLVEALGDHLAPYRVGDHYDVPVSFKVASGRRPAAEQEETA
jgi:hypothetical protein